MTFLIYFLLAHFLADYPLQSTKLVQLKTQRYLGVFLHGLIHLSVMLLVLFPLLHDQKIWTAVAIVYITHNIIDQTKVQLDKNNPGKARFFYFLDQFLHWSIIVAVSFYVGSIQPDLTGQSLGIYMNNTLVLYLFCMVLSTYFYDVTRYFIKLKKGLPHYHRDYKTMFRNGLIVTLAFGIYWLLY